MEQMGHNCSIEKIDLEGCKEVDAEFKNQLDEVLKVNHLIVQHIFPEVRKQEKKLKDEIQKAKMQKRGRRMGKTFKEAEVGIHIETQSAKHSDADLHTNE